MPKHVYAFGPETQEGNAGMAELLGGKGANLAEMAGLGLPVPPGFTITTEVCRYYYKHDKAYPDGLAAEVKAALAGIEAAMRCGFGDAENPLLVSVRSGARASMPGMMDTVLNLGLNDETARGLAARSGDARFVHDSYRRFIQMYGDVVMGVPHHEFEDFLEDLKRDLGFIMDTELSADHWEQVVEGYKRIVEEETGRGFPQDPMEQLWGAIGAVFGSWKNPRAVTYRRLHNIPASWGTAVTVQAMVFGNMGEDCATGVAFTRNPSTGENSFYGEYLVNAQGEDVVAGIRTPQPLAGDDAHGMERVLPAAFAELSAIRKKLEAHYRDMQDIEFTVQQGRLYMLQTRSGKRTAEAAIRIAVEMANEGLLDRQQAVDRIDAASLDQLLHPRLDPDAERVTVGRGLPASPGAASGEIVFFADQAEAKAQGGASVILVRVETSPEDIHGMHAARGILTSRGGMTSHAAVVARGMGRPCVAGAGSVQIDAKAGTMKAGGRIFRAGEIITIDGSTGEVMAGAVPTLQPELSPEFETLMSWADALRSISVRANAETPEDARVALRFGAEGIGLCRTEHMFFDDTRILAMREMILAEDEAGRRKALEKLAPMQRGDFAELFRIMEGLPVTIRLLDPPLHEFLPHGDAETADLAKKLMREEADLRRRLARLEETNPMLGHRGCRLGITFPEIYEMQARCIFEALVETKASAKVEIMVPLVFGREELDALKSLIDSAAASVKTEHGCDFDYMLGTMIELPRAALRAGDIAKSAEFFSFGTNDLTQTCFGLSRDDAGNFLPHYLDEGLLPADPFVSLDKDGVGELIALAAERGRASRPDIKLGICGEHGGDPASVRLVREMGLDYVSCSPWRVPIARLSAAQS
jgi:pyruvate,orthophosphate dikinase